MNDPREATGHLLPAAAPIELRRVADEEASTCVRCRSNPALCEVGRVVRGLVTLDSPDGAICGGCITIDEEIALGEAILVDLRRGQPRNEKWIRALEDAVADLLESGSARDGGPVSGAT